MTPTAQTVKYGPVPTDMHADTTAAESDKLVTRIDVNSISSSAVASPAPLTRSNTLYGLFLCAISTIPYSLMTVFAALCSTDTQHPLSAAQILLVRCSVLLVGSLIISAYQRIHPFGSDLSQYKWLLLRGICGLISIGCLYVSLHTITLADATTIYFIGTAVGGVASWLLFGERFDVLDALISLLSVAGCVLVVRPSWLFDSTEGDTLPASVDSRFFAICACFAGMLASVVVGIVIRGLGLSLPASVSVGWAALSGVLVTPPLIMHAAYTSTATSIVPYQPFTELPVQTWIYLLLTGCCSFAGQMLNTAGLQRSNMLLASVMRNLDVPLIFLWQWLILHQPIITWSVIGAAIVMVSTAGMAVKQHYQKQWASEKAEAIATAEDGAELAAPGGATQKHTFK